MRRVWAKWSIRRSFVVLSTASLLSFLVRVTVSSFTSNIGVHLAMSLIGLLILSYCWYILIANWRAYENNKGNH